MSKPKVRRSKSKRTHWSDRLIAMRACKDAVRFARMHRSVTAAWHACERSDWLLWYAARCVGRERDATHIRVVRAALACAKTAWPYVREADRPVVQRCYQVIMAWLEGQAIRKEALLAAASAASDHAASAASDYAASAASYAASDYAAYAAANTAAYAANTAAYAASAAASYAADAAGRTINRRLVRLVRRHLPRPPKYRHDD